VNNLVAVVDDEEDIRALVRASLEKERFRVQEYCEGKGFLASLASERPDLLVLDLILPDMHGFDICRRLRTDGPHTCIPVIILSALTDEADGLLGLSLGADDYVVKPFSPKELAMRVKAVLRREPKPVRTCLNAGGGLVVDVDTLEAFSHGERLELTRAEFRILQLLASGVDWVFPRQQILDYLWGHTKRVTRRSVDVHVKHLREKLGEQGGRIVNVRSIGYKLLSVGSAACDEGDEA
jgi:DNA-binding response OmpR family regulator